MSRIEATDLRIDCLFERGRAKSSPADTARIEIEQASNDQAYPLLSWGQSDIEIDDVCRRAPTTRLSHADWPVRRPWYPCNPRSRRLSGLSFEDRAASVLDRTDETKGSAWARTMFHHTARNEIAHGKLRSTRIDVTAFAQDRYLIQSALHRAA